MVPEAGRPLAHEQQRIERIAQPGTELFGHLLLSRSMYLYDQALKAGNQDETFFDRSIIEPIAYWRSHGLMTRQIELAVERYRYATDVFMAPPWPELFTRDTEQQQSFDPKQAEYHRLMAAFEHFGYRPIVLPKLPSLSVPILLRLTLEHSGNAVAKYAAKINLLDPGRKRQLLTAAFSI